MRLGLNCLPDAAERMCDCLLICRHSAPRCLRATPPGAQHPLPSELADRLIVPPPKVARARETAAEARCREGEEAARRLQQLEQRLERAEQSR